MSGLLFKVNHVELAERRGSGRVVLDLRLRLLLGASVRDAMIIKWNHFLADRVCMHMLCNVYDGPSWIPSLQSLNR